MTILAFIALVVIFALVIDRKDKRHGAQVADLCQRVQAPEVAVALHATEGAHNPAHLPFDDDSAWTAYMDETRERVKNG